MSERVGRDSHHVALSGRSCRGGRGSSSNRGGRGRFRGGRGGASPKESRSKLANIDDEMPGPGQAIIKLESKINGQHKSDVKNLTSKKGSLTVEQTETSLDVFSARPTFGSMGKGVFLWANYFPVRFRASVLYNYVLQVTEETISAAESKEKTQTKDVSGRKLHVAFQDVMR